MPMPYFLASAQRVSKSSLVQQGVYVEVVGGVVAVVGVGLEDGVQVKVIHPHLAEVGQLHLDALEVAAEIVLVQVAAHLIGLPEGLGVFVGLIEPVGEGHGLVLHALAEAVGEDLVEHLALMGAGVSKSASYTVICQLSPSCQLTTPQLSGPRTMRRKLV